MVADADIVAEAIRLYVALLGLLSGRLLDCGIFFSFLSVPVWRFFVDYIHIYIIYAIYLP